MMLYPASLPHRRLSPMELRHPECPWASLGDVAREGLLWLVRSGLQATPDERENGNHSEWARWAFVRQHLIEGKVQEALDSLVRQLAAADDGTVDLCRLPGLKGMAALLAVQGRYEEAISVVGTLLQLPEALTNAPELRFSVMISVLSLVKLGDTAEVPRLPPSRSSPLR